MSLLSICQAVARVVKFEVPDTIIGNTSDEAQLLLQCANDEGEALARRPSGGWIEMQREENFQTVVLTPPTATIANTAMNGDAQVTLTDTSAIVAHAFGAAGTGLPYNCNVRSVDSATQVTLSTPTTNTGIITNLTLGQFGYPVPDDFERAIDNTMWDRTRYWQMRGPLSPQQWQFYKSSVFSRATIQRRIRFRLLVNVGVCLLIDPVPSDNGSDLVYEYVSNGWCQSNIGKPQNQWLANDDTGILDEYLIRLGTKWRCLDRLGMDYSSALDEYERECGKAVAQNGAAPTLNLAAGFQPFLLGPYSVQDGFFPGPGS